MSTKIMGETLMNHLLLLRRLPHNVNITYGKQFLTCGKKSIPQFLQHQAYTTLTEYLADQRTIFVKSWDAF